MRTLKLHIKKGTPKYQQIYFHIKELILNKTLKSDDQLPSIRQLSIDLKVSRNTILSAYDQLLTEGYIRSEGKKGYFVNSVQKKDDNWKTANYTILRNQIPTYTVKFQPNAVDQDSFPTAKWRQCTNLAMEQSFIYSKDHYQGDPFLRQQLSYYLLKSRGINADSQSIVIGSSKQELLMKIGLLLNKDYHTIICEDPGFESTRKFSPLFDFDIYPMPISERGTFLRKLPETSNSIFYTTPSHQFPTGVTMPIYERQKLIEWAYNSNSFIIEDDHDSEFRYSQQPIPALASHDLSHVIYLGSFAESFLPTMRVSYMILPPKLLKEYHQAFSKFEQTASTIHQRAMAIFMEDGFWESHIRKMRNTYKNKMETLTTAIEEAFSSDVEVLGKESGLYILLQVKIGYTEQQLVQKAANSGVKVYRASRYFIKRKPKYPLIQLGFGGNSNEEILKGVELLKEAWS
ncbi:MAG TPA: PLP-dependent aminotransferase family protein [Rummeliibacillus sp.]|nr:PLP-dependent aminotransferase family protein [Rummeliibacillus sp.]